MRHLRYAAIVLALGLCARPAGAQSRPLVTEDPETVPAGHILFESGIDHARGAVYPVSGLRGNLSRIGTFGLSIGISSMAELQIDGGLANRLTITDRDALAPLAGMLDITGDSTRDIEDLIIGAKVRFVAETLSRPAIAFRFRTRLPNAGNESGLGLDTTDFHAGIFVAKTVQSVRVAGNFGLGILADPVRGDRQNDVVDYGISVARAVRQGVELVGELNGRQNTRSGEPLTGLESRSNMRVGARVTRGPVRVDGALAIGITDFDPSWGFTTGLTWVFRGFTVQ